MQTPPKPARAQPNPVHRHQVFWQIWFPLGLTALIAAAAAVLTAVFSASGQVSSGQLASVSIIWMLLPLIPAGILFMVFTVGMIFLLARGLRILPVYSRLILIYTEIIQLRLTAILDRLVSPIIQGRSRAAGWKSIITRSKRV